MLPLPLEAAQNTEQFELRSSYSAAIALCIRNHATSCNLHRSFQIAVQLHRILPPIETSQRNEIGLSKTFNFPNKVRSAFLSIKGTSLSASKPQFPHHVCSDSFAFCSSGMYVVLTFTCLSRSITDWLYHSKSW
jgi:hypothetical protein